MPYGNQKSYSESNVNYLNKDFSSLKSSLINYAKSYFPNSYKDFNETSPGMMLLEMSAYVGDVLSFYIDNQYKEMMLPLTEERRNINNIAKMLGYKVKPTVPAFVDLVFTQDVTTVTNPHDPEKIDYSRGGIFDKGIVVTSATDSTITFETLDRLDFSITGSAGSYNYVHDDKDTVANTDDAGLATSYTLSRKVRAISAERKTKTFNITAPTKFLRLTLPESNVIDIISVTDSNNNRWYEVDYLAQDYVPIETHYTDDWESGVPTDTSLRKSAYYDITAGNVVYDTPVPYSLTFIETNKKFTREVNEDNTTSLVFGNGILKDVTDITNVVLDLEQAGITIPGQSSDLNDSISAEIGLNNSSLGEAPNQTVLTVVYRIGGGLSSNVSTNDLKIHNSPSSIAGVSTINVTNNKPARGGKDRESIEEIREKTKAFFTTQNRCVTKADYEARILNMSAKFGNIAKVYVSREDAAVYAGSTGPGSVANYIDGVNTLLADIGAASTIEAAQDVGTIFAEAYPVPTTEQITEFQELGTIKVYVLSYDKNKNLVGNPHANELETSDDVPLLLEQNIQEYLKQFKILTDDITIQDGYIVNFGVFFEVVAEKYTSKDEVNLRCIETIKDYFNIDNMKFNQPLYTTQLEYILMGIEGVRHVNYVTITQQKNHNVSESPDQFEEPLFKYSFENSVPNKNGLEGYNYKYDFQNFYDTPLGSSIAGHGVILPPLYASTPGVFELKNPNQNIRGRVL